MKNGQRDTGQREKGQRLLAQLAVLPIPLLLVAIAILWAADLRVSWFSPTLYWLVHYGSAPLGIVFIVIPAARSFAANGQPNVLMLGCGVLMLEIGAAALPTGAARSTGTGFAIYNTSVLLSALCHFAGVAISSRRKTRLTRSVTWLTVAYAGGSATMVLVIWLALTDRMPVFFIDGQGGTMLRTLVVSAAVALFLLTAALLWQTNRRRSEFFLRWYALGLVMLAVGLCGSMLIVVKDSPLQWVTRFTQFFGMIYMCAAILTSARASNVLGIPLTAVEDAWQEKEFLAGLRRQTPLGFMLRYFLAMAVVAAGVGLRLVLTAWAGPGLPAYIIFYPAIMVVALLAGLGPGLVATVLADFVMGYWVIPPIGQFSIASPIDRLGLLIFTGMGLFVSVIAELYRRNRDKAAAYDREAALRESHARLAAFAEATFEGIVESEAGRIVDCNEQLARMLGYSVAELKGIEIASLIPPEERDRVMANILPGRDSTIEHRMLRKDGSGIVVEAHGQPISPGSAKRHTAVRDITDRKRAEEALVDDLAATTRLHQIGARFVKAGELADVLGEIVDAAIAITHADMGNIQLLDARSGGLRVAAFRGFEQPFLDFWNTVAEGEGACGTAMKNAQRVIVEDVTQDPIFVGTPALKVQIDAGVRAVQSTPLLGHSSTPIGMLSTHWHVPHRPEQRELHLLDLLAQEAVDIIEFARAEEALQRTAAMLDAIGASTPDAIFVKDRAGRMLYASPGTLRAANKTEDQVLGRIDTEWHPNLEEAKALMANDRWAMESGQSLVTEEIFTDSEGSHIFLSTKSPLLNAAGQVVGLVGLSRDITERKRTEQELYILNKTLENRVAERTAEAEGRALQLRQLAAELTLAEQRERQRISLVLHDGLQQILVAAKFHIALLGKTKDVPKLTAELAEMIDNGIETSRSLTAELSPPILRQGGLVPGLEWLVGWMRDKHGLTVRLASHRKIESAPEDVVILLFQSVRELLFNVAKHAGTRTARVEVMQEAGRIRVDVEDEGVGFDSIQLIKEGAKSRGMGLFSIQERLSYLGGSLEIDSTPGRGSRFKLTSPPISMETAVSAIHDQSIVSIAIASQREATVGLEKRVRVILVDDHMVMRQGLAGLLRAEPDIEIIGEASDGQSSIDLIRELRPDVVLMDISMPGMDGIQATRIIHSEYPEIRILGLSMFEDAERAQAMREAGAADYLTKTGPADALIEAIRACVRVSEKNFADESAVATIQ